jgi:hypothetical protein
MTPSPTNKNVDQLKQELAAIEHERWADWQKWCHEVLRKMVPTSPELENVLNRWDRQIATPYDQLTVIEKASDMEQVNRYWPLIEAYIDGAITEARIDELKSFVFALDEQNPYDPLPGTPKQYVHEKFEQRLATLSTPQDRSKL